MKYNEKYNRWVSREGLVYRYDSRQDKLVLCKINDNKGYYRTGVGNGIRRLLYVHRIVYETFKGEIPIGYEIDHIDTIKSNNHIDNLRMCTHRENNNNELSKMHHSIALLNKPQRPSSEFGRKFKEHYGITRMGNIPLYHKEHSWYFRNGKCRWEK